MGIWKKGSEVKKQLLLGAVLVTVACSAVADDATALAMVQTASQVGTRSIAGEPGTSQLIMSYWVPEETGDSGHDNGKGQWVPTDTIKRNNRMNIVAKLTFNPDAQGVPGVVYIGAKKDKIGAKMLTSAGWQVYEGGFLRPYAIAANGLPSELVVPILQDQTPCSLSGDDQLDFYAGYGLVTADMTPQINSMIKHITRLTPEHIVQSVVNRDIQMNNRYWQILTLQSCPTDHGKN